MTILPVPAGGARVLALPANPTVPVGYLSLRTFTTTAEAPLREAYADFRAQGIEYFIVDLRYNGGGLVRIAELIGDLNGAGARRFRRLPPDCASTRPSPGRTACAASSRSRSRWRPVRIAFITTGLTASASEIVINSLAPWTEVAIVGDDTLGKPVGQSGFDLSGCDLRLRLIGFQFTNANDQGDYYEGLAGTLPFACRADDDLMQEPGDAAEGSTAEALAWLGTGACSEVLAARQPTSARPEAAVRDPPGRGGRQPPRPTCPASSDGRLGRLDCRQMATGLSDRPNRDCVLAAAGQLATLAVPQRRIRHGHLEGHCRQGFDPARCGCRQPAAGQPAAPRSGREHARAVCRAERAGRTPQGSQGIGHRRRASPSKARSKAPATCASPAASRATSTSTAR